MLYTLVLWVCLAGPPDRCESREELIDGLAAHPAAAFVQAQALVARWQEAHPWLAVQRWALRSGRGA